MSGILPVARRWWWLLAVATAVAGVTGYAVASRVTPTYEAETRLLVGPINTDNDTLRAASALAQTYAALATSRPLIESTARDLGLSMSPDQLAGRVDAVANDVTRLLAIRVEHEDGELAATIANKLADNLATLPARGLSRPEGQLQVVDRARPSSEPTGPGPLLIAVLAGLAGLLGAVGIALLAESLDDTVRSGRDLAQLAPVSFLGSVNGTHAARGQALVVEARPESRSAAAYRLLATKIEYANGDERPRSLLVATLDSGAAAAQLAANLAGALAENRTKVTLADAGTDGEIARLFGLDGTGSSDLVEPLPPARSSSVEIERFRSKRRPGLVLVPRLVTASDDPAEVKKKLDALLADSHMLVLATGRVNWLPSALVWARAADATILVAERNRTKRDAIPLAAESLELVGARVIGAVLGGDRH